MISVVIPTFKNINQLIINLQKNIPFLSSCEIIIVNDDPNESIKKKLAQFTNIILVENKKNLGFSGSVDRGIKLAKNQYVMLLNNDVILNDQTYKETIDLFERDKKLFAVSFAQKEKNNLIVGKNEIYWHNGFFQHRKATDRKFGNNGWAEGGATIIDKEKYNQIGGFDSLYSPFYWEDIDLSYRAKKTGYSIVFEPNVIVEHHHESTIGKYYNQEFIHTIAFRNQLIFIWKNITDFKLITEHLFFLLPNIFRQTLAGKFFYLKGLLKALLLLPLIFKKRLMLKYLLTDRKILSSYE